MTARRAAISALAVFFLPAGARALPRFAARNGMECIQCHVNPTGGGIRNEYGRNVFERMWLPASGRPRVESWMAEPPPASGEAPKPSPDEPAVTFSPDLTEWIAVGADVRTAFIAIRPDRGPMPGVGREVTKSFFLMQADLYHAATLDEHLTLVLDVGIYSGFEAWGLLRPFGRKTGPYDLLVKVGRFMPPFGIREVEHQLFTREAIGLGATDRDTGIEVSGYAGPLTLHLALLNGTLGDTPFDTAGKRRRTFEKAAAARLALRGATRSVRAQAGGSAYYSQNNSQPNPLLAGGLPPSLASLASQGLDEIRAGGFVTANLGRLTFLGDLALVQNRFYSDKVPRLTGYASYQELSLVAAQGLELVGTLEFMDPDTEILRNGAVRVGGVVEIFPWPFMELRAMARRTSSEASATGGTWDMVLFAHFFM